MERRGDCGSGGCGVRGDWLGGADGAGAAVASFPTSEVARRLWGEGGAENAAHESRGIFIDRAQLGELRQGGRASRAGGEGAGGAGGDAADVLRVALEILWVFLIHKGRWYALDRMHAFSEVDLRLD